MKQPSEKLKRKWNKKLIESGFYDIENEDGSFKNEIHSRTVDYALKDAREEYYYKAQDFLNSGKFANLLEYTVWKMHAEGISYRNIAKELGLTFFKIQRTVKKIQKLMGVKK